MINTIQENGLILSAKQMVNKPEGYILDRPRGLNTYLFLHFYQSVDLLTNFGTVTTQPDACYIYPPNVAQRFRCKKELQYDYVCIDKESAELLKDYNIETGRVYYPHPTTYISSIIKDIADEFSSKNEFYEQMINSKLGQLIIITSRYCNNRAVSVNKELAERFHNVRFKMLNNLNDSWSVARMAEEANISPSYFHSIYKEIYGVSPTQDLINAKIEKAKYMLQYGRESIATISKSLGYSSPYHFTRQFRQITGESPSKYRTRIS